LGATHFLGNGVMERDFYLSSQFSADPFDPAGSTACIYRKASPENQWLVPVSLLEAKLVLEA